MKASSIEIQRGMREAGVGLKAWQQYLFMSLPAVIATIALAPYLHTPLSTNEGIFGAVALAMDKGGRLYTDAWDHKPPMIFLFYRIAGVIFGREEVGLHWAAILIHIVNAYGLVALMLRLGLGRAAAYVSACLYSVMLFSASTQPWTLQAEVLQLPLILGSLLLALTHDKKSLLVAGVLWSLAFFTKQQAILLLPLYLILWKGRSDPWNNFGWFLLGANSAALAVAAPFAVTGRMSEFWMAVSAYNLHGYVPAGFKSSFQAGEALWIGWLREASFDFVGMGLVAIAGLVLRVHKGLWSRTDIVMWTWLALSLLSGAATGMVHGYYILFSFCAIAALASLAVAEFSNQGTIKLAIVLALICIPFLFRAEAERRSGAGETVLQRQFKTSIFDVSKIVGSRLHMIRSAGDQLLVWGRIPQLYVYADMPPSIARTALISHSYFLPGELDNVRRGFSAEEPRFVVISNDLDASMPTPAWLSEAITRDYVLNQKDSKPPSLILYEKRKA